MVTQPKTTRWGAAGFACLVVGLAAWPLLGWWQAAIVGAALLLLLPMVTTLRGVKKELDSKALVCPACGTQAHVDAWRVVTR